MLNKKYVCLVVVSAFLITIAPCYAAQVLFTPQLFLNETYTSNLWLSESNEEETYITEIGLNLGGQVLWRTAGIDLNYRPSYNSFKENSELDNWRHLASIRIWKEFTRATRFELTDIFLQTSDPQDSSEDVIPDDPSADPAIPTDISRRDRNETRSNIAVGRFSYNFGQNDNFALSLAYSTFEELDPIDETEVNDNEVWQPSMELAYWYTQNWGVELDGYYSNRYYKTQDERVEYSGTIRSLTHFSRSLTGYVEYRHTVLDYDQETTGEDYKIYSPSIGLRYQYRENTRINIGVGYYIQDFDQRDDEEGWNINSGIYQRWPFRSGYIDFTGNSGYDIVDRQTEDLGLNVYYEGRLSAGYNVTSLFSINTFGSYRYDDFPNETPTRTDRTITAGSGLNYQMLRWMNIGLSYEYTTVSSDIETSEYDENRVMLTITIAPSSPYRLN